MNYIGVKTSILPYNGTDSIDLRKHGKVISFSIKNQSTDVLLLEGVEEIQPTDVKTILKTYPYVDTSQYRWILRNVVGGSRTIIVTLEIIEE